MLQCTCTPENVLAHADLSLKLHLPLATIIRTVKSFHLFPKQHKTTNTINIQCYTDVVRLLVLLKLQVHIFSHKFTPVGPFAFYRENSTVLIYTTSYFFVCLRIGLLTAVYLIHYLPITTNSKIIFFDQRLRSVQAAYIIQMPHTHSLICEYVP